MTDLLSPCLTPAFAAALAHLAADHDRFVSEIITLTQTPAPTFDEGRRAETFARLLKASGLPEAEIDGAGNVCALRRGTGPEGGPVVVAAAHLDTVFPIETDVTVRREGTILHAPGVGDDTRGLAALLAFIRALDAGGVETAQDILFVANVGEEGLGDLRGTRHLFSESRWKDRIAAFFTFDDIDTANLTTGGIGSLRYRLTLHGPGGHSLNDFGRPNPAYALGTVLTGISRLDVPASPRSTHCASTLAGGTSINAIPEKVELGIDLRSEDAAILQRLKEDLAALIEVAVAEENRRSGVAEIPGAMPLRAELTELGHRPAGQTDENSHIVRASLAAIRAEGFTPRCTISSTDANIPMSLGVPAVKFSHGGRGGGAHTLKEWIDVAPELSLRGLNAALRALVMTAAAPQQDPPAPATPPATHPGQEHGA